MNVELWLLSLMLAHDAFWLMDKVGGRTADRMAVRWHRLADEAGWVQR